MNRITLLSCCLLLCFQSFLSAEDDEYKYGLIGTYQSDQAVARRIDSDIAFNWGTHSPHSQIPAKDWEVNWKGQILIRSVSSYQLHAKLNGSLSIIIDGEEVFAASSDQSEWVSGETLNLPPGFQEIEVSYRPSASGAEVKLFWSNDAFSVEPIPSHQLFHVDENSEIVLIEKGRQLVDAHHCANCHRSEKTIDHLYSAPALWGVVSGMNPEWIVQKLLGKNPESKSDQMPHFGLNKEQAEDIAAYLHRLEAPFDLMTAPDSKPKKGEMNGAELFNSLGCLACHQVNGLGTDKPFSGGDLSHVGNKRSTDWFATWLSSPDRINPQHRMPKYKLSRTERGLLAKYLATLGKEKNTKFGRAEKASYTESSIRGQALVKEFQCANCHKIPAIEATNKPVSPLTNAPGNWKNTCLAEKANPAKKRPNFPHLDRDAIAAYLNSLGGKKRQQISEFERGQRVIERRQCLACHSRTNESGLKNLAKEIVKATPALNGQTQLVIPPSLNAVGDKLQDSVLDVAVSGKQDRIRANWLKIKMPEFHHTPEEMQALKYYLIQHDRLPDEASQHHPEIALSENDLLLTGRKLVGAGGWSCIACHQIGDYVPKNTALGTRGSDLMEIGKRLRPEFYYRWTKAPIRVIPGMEMPSFTKPVPGVLDENVHQQLGAIFKAMNDPRFEPPTNPSQVEQLLQVADRSPPRIVRDVFTVDKANGGGAVARAFAIGFDNQHSLLLDLDQMTIRDWRYGDFASQRTIGKSWYWDLAGASVVNGLDAKSDLVLFDEENGLQELVGTDPERIAHLTKYEAIGYRVIIHYELRVQYKDKPLIIPVKEIYHTFDTLDLLQNSKVVGSGWERFITPQKLPSGVQLGFRSKSNASFQFEAKIKPYVEQNIKNFSIESSDEFNQITLSEGPGKAIRIHYDSSALTPQAQLPEQKIALAITDKVTTFPGYIGQRLPLPVTVMPTAIAQDQQGRLLVTSLKGDVYRVSDSDGDGIEENYELIQEGLSAPFGIVADGDDILVTHKPELVRLIDEDKDGHFEKREIVADGWGHSDNYHDWVTGPVLDDEGNLFIATGSDYSQPKRDRKLAKWRGKIVKASGNGEVVPFAHELRYPIGIATDAVGRIFVSDQQGVQNTFNEINHIVQDGAHGVPGQLDGEGSSQPKLPAVQIPHPWTRSVNGIFLIPQNNASPFAGHGVGCEYNGKFLIRFTTQEVNGELQGACYPLTKPAWESDGNTFLGPISGFAANDGSIYVGSIYDSGWLGGPNVGEVVKLKPAGEYGNGIREIRAVRNGFEIEFIEPIDSRKGLDKENYSLSGYTRIWQGSYATDDSGRYSPEISEITLSADHRTASLSVENLKPTFVYEFNLVDLVDDGMEFFPSFGAYTLNRIPE
ncbi:MAG: c-type cytochrome [Planctomicrobium sp.]|nr:c-type cytochrome [Planctomicrobium sp.]